MVAAAVGLRKKQTTEDWVGTSIVHGNRLGGRFAPPASFTPTETSTHLTATAVMVISNRKWMEFRTEHKSHVSRLPNVLTLFHRAVHNR